MRDKIGAGGTGVAGRPSIHAWSIFGVALLGIVAAASFASCSSAPKTPDEIFDTRNKASDYLKLADDRRVVCGISFGYAKHDHIINSYRTSRAPLSEAVTFVGD